MREPNGSFDSCNSCKRLPSRLHELHESRLPFVSGIELVRCNIYFFCSCIRGRWDRPPQRGPAVSRRGFPATRHSRAKANRAQAMLVALRAGHDTLQSKTRQIRICQDRRAGPNGLDTSTNIGVRSTQEFNARSSISSRRGVYFPCLQGQ